MKEKLNSNINEKRGFVIEEELANEEYYKNYLEYFKVEIDQTEEKIKNMSMREDFCKNKLKVQIEFVKYCKDKHPEDFEILKGKLMNAKKAILDRGWNLDDILFDF